MTSNLDAVVEPWDREAHAEIDRAIGRTMRAFARLEQSIVITFHCALYGLDRQVIEAITRGIPASTALEKVRDICKTPFFRTREPGLVGRAKSLEARANSILRRRNALAHSEVMVADPDASAYITWTSTGREGDGVSVVELDSLRTDAKDLSRDLLELGRQLKGVARSAWPPDDRNSLVHAFDVVDAAP